MRKVINQALRGDETWTQDGISFTEAARQDYLNSSFSSGFVEGAGVDTMYLRWQKDEEIGGMLLLRPDEVAAIAYVLAGVLWSDLIDRV